MATMPNAAPAAPFFTASPMVAGRVQTAPQPRLAPTNGTTYIQAPGAPLGPSFVAAPKVITGTPTILPGTQPNLLNFGAPAAPVPFRPSYVAAQPATATVSAPSTMATSTMPGAQLSTSIAAPIATGGAPALMTYATSATSVVPQASIGGYVTKSVAAPPVTVVSAAPAVAAPVITQRSAPVPPAAPAVSVDYVAALEKRLADLELIHACKTHSAVVFIKPHAVTEEVKELVKAEFANHGIFILSEGVILAEEIDQQQLIDTHYGAIAAKAVKLAPSELTVQPKAQDEFQQAFGLSWADALSQGAVFNAMAGAEALGISPEELGAKWGALTKGVDMLKFGGGFYCGKIDDIFVINGFYMNMRSKFTTPGTHIYYFETEWDARMLSWQDFRGRVLGATDPATAEEGSIRNLIFQNWEALGLAAAPDTGDNGVHASASPFEALAERANWLNVPIDSDFFGRALLASGIPLSTIQEWCSDPAVAFDGGKHSLFDLLEDTNSRECLQKAAMLASENADGEAENEDGQANAEAPPGA